MALIETVRDARSKLGQPGVESPCAEEEKAASGRVDESTRKTAAAQRFLNLRMWSEAEAEAKAALSLDSENQAASNAAAQAREGLASQKSALQRLQDNWKKVSERQVEPLTALLIPFTFALVLLIVLARLLVLFIRKWPHLEANPENLHSRILGFGVVALLVSAALFSFGVSSTGTEAGFLPLMVAFLPGVFTALVALFAIYAIKIGQTKGQEHGSGLHRFVWILLVLTIIAILAALFNSAGVALPLSEELPLLVLATVTGLLGAILTAWWLATRLRIEITVADSEGADRQGDVGLVAAMLNELGAQKPRGIEVPRGADVTALEGAIL
ncbi:hypothetical protein, partial [Arthrobacter globiformis]|uniref:hypothetical protein n=1 Tax=Arthrobacter globiformis TaxID=1665 RepID=UPI001125120B